MADGAEPDVEGEFEVTWNAGEKPGGGIAKAFAAVFTPAAGAKPQVGGMKTSFAPFGGPAEFAARAGAPFRRQETLERMAGGVAGLPPHEVENFMGKYPGKLANGAIESDAALAQKGPCMDGSAAVAQAGGAMNAHRAAAKRRQAAENAPGRYFETGISEPEDRRECHYAA